ncbi:glycoside hydrolase family 66 protein [Vallitalea guaymasensis]|uniref:CBM6 domain-containing protein n=1 Tax=Vallitalea guaymasensis TaxID=1185412 RepID=A0A8J8SCP5_9FIRM|nr:glycoside hydrolase family 66 protein [Vallitalea guaymasensis]QUH30053.1 hypothetical protein HYG85_14470 [Vallitalea guaymasensis]
MKKLMSLFLSLSLLLLTINTTGNIAFAADNCTITEVSVDKARYNTGDNVTISIEINNPDSMAVSKTVTTKIYHLENLVDTYSSVVDVQPNTATTHTVTWTAPSNNYTGYLISADIGDGVEVTTGVDVSNDFTRYPRYGYSVDFPVGETLEESNEMIEKLAKDYNINVVQYYDWMYRHDMNFPSTGNTWVDLFGNTISETTLQNRIDKGHALNQSAMAYQMAYMVREDYEDYSAKKEWGLYRNKDYNISYDKDNPSTINNIDQLIFPLEGSPAPILFAMNPANKDWQDFMNNQYTLAVNRLGFDGIQIDQMGDFWGNINYYDYWGNYVDLSKTFSDFVNDSKEALTNNNSSKNYLTMNAVNGAVPPNDRFSTWDIMNNADTDFQFSEIWQNSPTYDSLKKYIEWQKLTDGGKTMVLAAYMNQHTNAGTLYEAENASLSGLTSGNDNGTTYITGFDSAGDSADFNISVPEDGVYTLVFRFSNGASARADKNIYVDNEKVMTAYFDLTRTGLMPANPSWSNYSNEAAFTDPKTLYLTAGNHSIKVQHDSDNTGDIRVDSVTLGTFNKASVRLTDSAIAASGAMHIEMGTGLSMANGSSNFCDTVMLGHPYYPKAFKMMRDDLRNEMQNHYDFITAYENLLYDPDINPVDGGTQTISIENESVTGSGESGNIWFIPKTKNDDYGIVHLINLTSETNTNWRDVTDEPTTKNNLQVKYYIPYHKTVSNLYMASPDRNDCMTENLSFTTGTDSVGKYISFTVPELKYWDMIYFTFGNESEPSIYEAEDSIKKDVGTNNDHNGYTGSGFVDSYGETWDSVSFDIEVEEEGDYTLRFSYANATGSECSRELIVDNQNKGKISFQPLSDWDTWGIAEKGVHLLPGRHRLVVLVTHEYTGFINLDNLRVSKLSESVRGVYMNNWKDSVYLWKETQNNLTKPLFTDGPSIYELRFYEKTDADDYNRNEIKNYSMFFRDETDNKVYTTGSNFRASGHFGDDGIFYTDYETYAGEKMSPEISRDYAAIPNENFMVVRYTVKNNTGSEKTYNIMDMLHVDNHSNNDITASYDSTKQVTTIDMSGAGQYYIAHGTLESSVNGYQIADDTVSDTNSNICSPWHTFNNDGTLKNNGSVTCREDISTAFTKSVTLQSQESTDIYFYIAIGKDNVEIQNAIDTATGQNGSYWMNTMETNYSNWLNEGKSVNFDQPELNYCYENISVALKQSIVPGTYNDGTKDVAKFASLPATTNPSAYSYKVWARDSAVTAMSLDASGHTDEAEYYWYWLADRQIKVDHGDWRKPGTFWTCYWIWNNDPVSFVEPEYDSIGMFLVGAYRHYESLEEPAKTNFLNNIWEDYRRSADFAMNHIDSNGFGKADCSIWEEQIEYNAFTEALYAAGLDAAQEMAKAKGLQSLADNYNGAAGSIRSAIQRSSTDSVPGLWNQTDPNNRYYNRAVNLNNTPRTTVDASSDVLVTYGVIDMMSKRAYDHYNKVNNTIAHDTYGITRYEGDSFYSGKNSWDPGGVEAFEDEPSWPQMTMWVAMMELFSGYDSLRDNALRRLEWFADRTALGYAPQGEAVSNVTLKPIISTMIEPITGAAYIMTALTYEDKFDMRITPNQYNAGARYTVNVHDGCRDTSNAYDTISDWHQWTYIPYYLDKIGDNTAGDSSRDIKKIYISNDDNNMYIRIDNVGNTLPNYNVNNDKFVVSVYSQDFSNGSINTTNNGFYGSALDRDYGYMVTRRSDDSNYTAYNVDSNNSWQLDKQITSVIAPQWESTSGRIEMVIPLSELSSGSVSTGDWANMKIALGLDNGSGMQETDYMNIHYRITGNNESWLFGNSEE